MGVGDPLMVTPQWQEQQQQQQGQQQQAVSSILPPPPQVARGIDIAPGVEGAMAYGQAPKNGTFQSGEDEDMPGVLEKERLLLLKQAFAKCDVRGDGALTAEEWGEALAECGMPVGPQGLASFFSRFGRDRLSFQELMAAFHSPKPPGRPPQVMPATAEDGKFVDVQFPPNLDSILTSSNPQADHVEDLKRSYGGQEITWLRATELSPGGQLFNNVHPNDITQGSSLGNCWLLAALAGFAEFEGAVFSFFEERTASADGRYTMRLFNGREWEPVVIDDYIPISESDWRPLMAKPQGNEMWVLLAEKALAKWMGSYVKSCGAYCLVPYLLLTDAGVCKAYGQGRHGQPPFDRDDYRRHEVTLPDPHDRSSVRLEGQGHATSEVLWSELREADKSNYIVCAWTQKDPDGGADITSAGIVRKHSYPVISTREVAADGQRWRLVQLRNPWAAAPGAEWSGPLADRWPQWASFPELSQKLGIGNAALDGVFWMTWDDFREHFSDVGIVPKTMEVPRLGKVEVEAPMAGATARHGKRFVRRVLGEQEAADATFRGSTPQCAPMSRQSMPPQTISTSQTMSPPPTMAQSMPPQVWTTPQACVPTQSAQQVYAPPPMTASMPPTLSPTAGQRIEQQFRPAPAPSVPAVACQPPPTMGLPQTMQQSLRPPSFGDPPGALGLQQPSGGLTTLLQEVEQNTPAAAFSPSQLLRLKMTFAAYDGGTNCLSADEIAQVMAESDMPVDVGDLVRFFSAYEMDSEGRVSFQEFMSLFHSPKPLAAPLPIKLGTGTDGKFMDIQFPPSDTSIWSSQDPVRDRVQELQKTVGPVKWVRASHLAKTGKLFGSVHPNDIAQGALGDCALVAALCGIAEFEGALFHLLEQKGVSLEGSYTVRIYNAQNSPAKRWESVTVDDYVPVSAIDGEPLMAKPAGNDMWVLLVEKALAKFFGSYVRCAGAYCLAPYLLLTDAGPCTVFGQSRNGNPPFDGNNYFVSQVCLADSRDLRSVQFSPLGQASGDQAWEELRNADNQNFIVAAWTAKEAPGGPNANNLGIGDGLVKNVVYSVLATRNVVVDGCAWRVVLLRNPWARMQHAEWTGALGPAWDGWHSQPELARELGVSSPGFSGMFWMAWDDFRDRFSSVGIVPKAMEVPKLGQIEALAPTQLQGARHAKRFAPGSGGEDLRHHQNDDSCTVS